MLTREQYADLVRRVGELAADYHWETSRARLAPAKSGDELARAFQTEPPEQGITVQALFEQLETGFLSGLVGISNPRFMGYILTRPTPESHVFDTLANATHASPGAAQLAPGAILLEQQVLAWIRSAMGLPAGQSIFTSGGCEALLLALKCARDDAVGARRAKENMVLFASRQSHYGVARAWDIVGGSEENIAWFDPDDLTALRDSIRQCRAADRLPTAIVAALGTTNSGRIEPIEELAAIAREEGLWLHVDGAYGGAVLLLEEFAALRDAVGLAQSFSVDAHKWFGMPMGSGMLFLAPGLRLEDHFSFDAVFTRHVTGPVELLDQCQMSLEGTRPLHGLRIWAALSLLGFGEIRRRVRSNLDVAARMAELIDASSELRLVEKPQLSIVIFTIRGWTIDALREAAQRLYLSDSCYLTATLHGDTPCFRAAITNFETTYEDAAAVVASTEMLARGALR